MKKNGRIPAVTLVLLFILVNVYVLQMVGSVTLESHVLRIFGFDPSHFDSYMFLHANLPHLLFAMIFLGIFGWKLEMQFGGIFILALFFIGGYAAAGIWLASSSISSGGLIGSSAAISAMGAAYYISDYRNMQRLLFVVIWLILQVVISVFSSLSTGPFSFIASGLFIGAIIGFLPRFFSIQRDEYGQQEITSPIIRDLTAIRRSKANQKTELPRRRQDDARPIEASIKMDPISRLRGRVQKDPGNWELQSQLVEMYIETGLKSEAIYLSRGLIRLLVDRNDDSRAYTVYKRIIDAYGDLDLNPRLLLNLSRNRIDARDTKAAGRLINSLRLAESTNPSIPELLAELVRQLVNKHGVQSEVARSQFQTLIDFYPFHQATFALRESISFPGDTNSEERGIDGKPRQKTGEKSSRKQS